MGAVVSEPVAIEDLEELIGGKGWAWLKDQADREFGSAALVEKLRVIASKADESAELRQAKTEQAFVSQATIRGFMDMPVREIQRRREAIQKRPDAFAGARHRGGTL